MAATNDTKRTSTMGEVEDIMLNGLISAIEDKRRSQASGDDSKSASMNRVNMMMKTMHQAVDKIDEIADSKTESENEKVERLKKGIDVLKIAAFQMPRGSQPRLELLGRIAARENDREAIIEGQLVKEVVHDYLDKNSTVLELTEQCPICMEPIWSLNSVLLCCGKPICGGCHVQVQKNSPVDQSCPLCRTSFRSYYEGIIRMLQSKSDDGVPWASYMLSELYNAGIPADIAEHLDGTLEANPERRLSLLRSSANKGYPSSQFLLGQHHYFRALKKTDTNNNAVDQDDADYSQALGWLHKAASQGNMNAVGLLGGMSLNGEDEVEGVKLLRIANSLLKRNCVHDFDIDLANAFLDGKGGLPKTFARARYYLKPMAEAGDPESMLQYAKGLMMDCQNRLDGQLLTAGCSPIPLVLFLYRKVKEAAPNREYASEEWYVQQSAAFESIEETARECCAHCDRNTSAGGEPLRLCTECKAVCYCSRECQLSHWRAGHKRDCIKYLDAPLKGVTVKGRDETRLGMVPHK